MPKMVIAAGDTADVWGGRTAYVLESGEAWVYTGGRAYVFEDGVAWVQEGDKWVAVQGPAEVEG